MIITQTPLRVSLLGGNTDYPDYFNRYGGVCLTVAIDKYIYCIVKKRFDKQIWINYSKKEIVNNVDDIKHDLVREAMKLVGVTEGIEITFLSDIPSEGSGLGSSSAVTVGLLNALHQYKGNSVPHRQLAEEACMIELDILRKPIGIQDQYAVTYGGCKKFEFKKNSKRVVTLDQHFEDTFRDSLMLFYTDQQRKAESVLSWMKLDTDILNKNKELAIKGVKAMANYDVVEFGELLNQYWQLKKKLNKRVTNSFINDAYQKALFLGATGGKIVGAGGGGFLLLVVPHENKQNIRENIALRELPFNLSRTGSRVIFNI